MKNRFEITTKRYRDIHDEFDMFIQSSGYKTTKDAKNYQAYVREYLWWLESNGILSVKKIDVEVQIKYVEYISTRPKMRGTGVLSQSSIDKHFFSIKLLFDLLLNTQRLDSIVAMPSYYKAIVEERNILTKDEMKELYHHTTSATERAVLTLAYGCGLRRSEIEMLNYRDVNLKSSYLTVRDGKGGKLREVPLSEKTVEYLRDYLLNERENLLSNSNALESAFLINMRGKRMSGETAGKRLAEIISRTENAEIESKRITLHNLRHTIATHLLENGAEIHFVRDFLGHVEIDTVQVYAKRRKRNKVFTV